jgi:hypothetical protein
VCGGIVHAISGCFTAEPQVSYVKKMRLFCVISGSCCLETLETEHFKGSFINMRGSATDLKRRVQTCDTGMENVLLKQSLRYLSGTTERINLKKIYTNN